MTTNPSDPTILRGWWDLHPSPDGAWLLTISVDQPDRDGRHTTPKGKILKLYAMNYALSAHHGRGLDEGILEANRLMEHQHGLRLELDDRDDRYKCAKGTLRLGVEY